MIAGIPILKIRDYLRKFSSGWISVSELGEYFRLNHPEAEILLHELINKGLLEYQEKKYRLTVKGRALCIARCVPPMDKEKADQIFRQFMQRVQEVNEDDYYLYKISKLLLFGSYLDTRKQDFGDIDIAFELEQKIKDNEEFLYENARLVEEAILDGRRFLSLWDEVNYSRHIVLLKLKDRNPYISLHPIWKDKILNNVRYKQVYP